MRCHVDHVPFKYVKKILTSHLMRSGALHWDVMSRACAAMWFAVRSCCVVPMVVYCVEGEEDVLQT